MKSGPKKLVASSRRTPVRAVRAVVKNGRIQLPPAHDIPDGTAVQIVPIRSGKKKSRAKARSVVESARAALRKFEGTIKGLPSDLAAQHDHYIYGQPKR